MQESQEMPISSLGQEDALEKEMAIHSILLPGESQGQRSLVGYSPKGHKESDTTERLSTQHEYCLERFKKINMFNTN